MRYILIGLHWFSVVVVAHALMLLGADEITTIERGGILTVRSLGQVLALYRADLAPLVAAMPGPLQVVFALVLSWPAWMVLFVAGGLSALVTRARV